MFKDLHELENYILEENIEFVDLYYTDMFGNFRHLSTPSKNLATLAEEGLAFDGSSVHGFQPVECGDLLLIPDIRTAFRDPFHDSNVILLCKQVDAETKELSPADPRMIAIKGERYLKETLDAESLWLPEFEFNLFDNVTFGTSEMESFYGFYTSEYSDDESSMGHASARKDGYHTTPPQDHFFHVRAQMVSVIESLGIPVHYHHHEVGGAGQQEIEIKLRDLVGAADAVQMIKYIIRMIALGNDLSACFLPKPLFNHPGNGMHFHQVLMKDGKSMFWEEGGYANFSKIGLSYIAGLLKHAPALVAFTNPSTNSYKRLLPGFEAPTRIFFGLANRAAAIRIPKYTNSPETKRMEFRPPDATANPYLAVTAMLMAGLDGIANDLDPTKMGFGPYDEDVTKWPERKKRRLKEIPTSLPEALDALKKDHSFLLEGGVFTKQFIDKWIEKKTAEYLDVIRKPSASEIEKYYNV